MCSELALPKPETGNLKRFSGCRHKIPAIRVMFCFSGTSSFFVEHWNLACIFLFPPTAHPSSDHGQHSEGRQSRSRHKDALGIRSRIGRNNEVAVAFEQREVIRH